MPPKINNRKEWKREHKIAFAGVCVTATGVVITLLVNSLKSSSPSTKNTASVEVNHSPGAVVPTMVGSPNSTQIVKLNERTIFIAPSDQVTKETSRNLAELKGRYPKISVRLEAESNSSQRFKVAEILGGLLSTAGLGHFNQGTYIGISPSHPITIFFGQEDDKFAKELSAAIAPHIRGATLFTKDKRLGTNICRLYLNGTPLFQSNGQVIFE